jgi:hypothetical protein
MKKITGAICLGAGVVLLIWGYNIAHGVNSQVKSLFTGSPTDQAMYRYIGGGILAAVGVLLIFSKKNK